MQTVDFLHDMTNTTYHVSNNHVLLTFMSLYYIT